MGEYHILGGKRLRGEVRISGSKNAVLPMFAAMVLNGSKCILHNCPRILDTFISIEILRHIGCKVTMEDNEVLLTDTFPLDLIPVTTKLRAMGCGISETESTIALKAPPRLQYIPKLETGPHPGFPTDLQAPFVSALVTADGTSLVAENVFNSRSGHIPELSRMGGGY